MVRRNNHGFSLIELMIVVAIIAILAAVAYPSYQQHVRRTAITEAHMSLNSLAQAMERFRAQNGTYSGSHTASVPDIFRTQSPESGSPQFNLLITEATATDYTVQAVSVGGIVDGGDNLTLDEIGNIGGTLASEVD